MLKKITQLRQKWTRLLSLANVIYQKWSPNVNSISLSLYKSGKSRNSAILTPRSAQRTWAVMASRNLLQFSQRSGRSRKNRACKNKNRPCLLKFRNQIWRSGKDCGLRGGRALSSECTIARRTTIKCFVLNFLSSPRNGICLTYLLYQLVACPLGCAM